MKDPSKAAAKWARNLGGAAETIRDGVQRVTVSPGVKAAAQKAAYLAGVTQSADKWQRNVGATSLADWQAAILGKGLERISSGVADGESKVTAFLQQLMSYQASGLTALPARGAKGSAANKQRMTAWMDYMSKFKRRP